MGTILTYNKIVQPINLRRNKLQDVKIYTYRFFDGKIYIGYSIGGLELKHHLHKTHSISPLYRRLNNPETEVYPKYEKTVNVEIESDEFYKIQREILDTYTNDTNQILNTNLKLFGY